MLELKLEHPNNLRPLRANANLTQKEIAERLGVHQAEYGRMEKGRRRIGRHLGRLSEILSCEPSVITEEQNLSVSERPTALTLFSLPEIDGEGVRIDGEMTSTVPCPEILKSTAGAFAIYNHGNQMAPRLRHGDLLFCDPKAKLKHDDVCVISRLENLRTGIVRIFDRPLNGFITQQDRMMGSNDEIIKKVEAQIRGVVVSAHFHRS
jgi:transcriptional regulator with XRE-family HTH domain